MDKEYMKSYMLRLHEANLTVLDMYAICFIQYYSSKYRNGEISLDEGIDKIFKFVYITADEDCGRELRSEYVRTSLTSGKEYFFYSIMDPYEGIALRVPIKLDNYTRATMPHIHKRDADKRAVRIQALVDEFPDLSEYMINLLRGEGEIK